jgi:chemotaxis response regulator CheB
VSTPIRILLVDDQALFRESLALLLEAQPDLQVVGEAANGEAALDLVAAVRPHIVLMDLRMPILDGVAATRRLRAEHPDVQVIALTTFDDGCSYRIWWIIPFSPSSRIPARFYRIRHPRLPSDRLGGPLLALPGPY